MKLLCALLLFHIWACGQTSSIGSFDDLQSLKISDQETWDEKQVPVEQAEDIVSNYQQGYVNYGENDYNNQQGLKISDQNMLDENQVPVEQADDLIANYLQGYENYAANNYKNDAGDQFLDYPGNENENTLGDKLFYETNDQYQDPAVEKELEYSDSEVPVGEDLENFVLSPEERYLADQLNKEYIDQLAEETGHLLDESYAGEAVDQNVDQTSNLLGEDYVEEKGELKDEIQLFDTILSEIDNENNEYENQNLEETILEHAQMYEDDIGKDSDSISDYSSNVDYPDSGDKLNVNFINFGDTVNAIKVDNVLYESQNIDVGDTVPESENLEDNLEEIVPASSQIIRNADIEDLEEIIPGSYQNIQDAGIYGLEDLVPDNDQNIHSADISNLEDILPDSYHSYQIIQGASNQDLENRKPDNNQNIQIVKDLNILSDYPSNFDLSQSELDNNQNIQIEMADIAKDLNSLSDYPSNFDLSESEPIKNKITWNDYEQLREKEFVDSEPKIVDPVLQVKIISFEGDEYVLSEADDLEIEYPYEAPGFLRRLVLLSGPLLMVLGVFLLCVACCHIPRKNKKSKKGTALLTTVDYKPMMNEA